MRVGRMSSWASALVMASGGMVPGIGTWPLTMGAWTFFHTNDGDEDEYGRSRRPILPDSGFLHEFREDLMKPGGSTHCAVRPDG
jgi:hypothetical protein